MYKHGFDWAKNKLHKDFVGFYLFLADRYPVAQFATPKFPKYREFAGIFTGCPLDVFKYA